MPQVKIISQKGFLRTIVSVAVFACLFFSTHIVLADWIMPPPPVGAPQSFDSAIINATNWILGFVAMIAVLALIWGGVNYLTSAGDENKAGTGKKVMEYALIGLVIAGISYALVVVIITVIF